MHINKNVNFNEDVLSLVEPRTEILDLGSGEKLIYAKEFAAKGALVTAIDRVRPAETVAGITFIQRDIASYLPEIYHGYHLIHLRYLIQFLEKKWVLEKLLPKLLNGLKPGGYLAIKTFTQEAEPPFNRGHSFYGVPDLYPVLKDCTPLRSADYIEHEGPDIPDGIIRKYFSTEIIVQKT